MARYMVSYTKKYDRKIYESDVFSSYTCALKEAEFIKSIISMKTMIVLRDYEGQDNLENSGKFFLFRILK